MSGIWVISETPKIAWEMLAKARELAGNEVVTAFVVGDYETGMDAISFGADQVLLLEMPANIPWEECRDVILKAGETNKPSLIMVAATRRGKDLAAQLAALLDAPCVSECKSIIKDGENFLTERIVYGGLAVKKMVSNGCLVATIPPGTYHPEKIEGRSGDVKQLKPQGFKMVVRERRPKPATSVNISDANIVVGVGRGFGSKEEIQMAERLADILDGAIGCTRPVAEDLRWLPEECYIGLSGQVVRPALYLCAGVSGQVQHVYGIRDAKTIVAVEKNENAPIIRIADYYILGDLKEVLPALIGAFAKAK
ncbi:MAG: electron transfer flavoprotein subunit alpha/FixB family protein [Bacillota bacterium]|jgi:electron transfer flavoprotein alpha subunit|nr:electron transfer flavoprotein subunit alpha/FixB family protein [Clostridia bacterium]